MNSGYNSYTLTIMLPTNTTSITIDWIMMETTYGSLEILAGHTPLLAVLQPNTTITFQPSGTISETSMPINQGICQVERNHVTIIMQHA